MPIRRKTQVITEKFGAVRPYGLHQGVDLRSRRWEKGKGYVEQWALQDVIVDGVSEVLRFGTDPRDNDFIVLRPLDTPYDELKYIHVTLNKEVKEKNKILEPGDVIGKTQVKGSSRGHHLHFEVWKFYETMKVAIDPIKYFNHMGIKYKMKD
jgi:murein DD-endopeptidase MepM/ murein hydrolase activator NlpD